MDYIRTFAISIEDLRLALEARDMVGVDVDFHIWTGGITALRLELSYRTEAFGDRETLTLTLPWAELTAMSDEEVGAWMRKAISDAWDWIEAIPSAEEIAHRAFMAQLGRLIDKGREVGVDVDFLNPLTAMMEKLATNALEDKRKR